MAFPLRYQRRLMDRPETLSLVGGALCLDFANTLEWRGTDHSADALASYDDLARWTVHVGALTASVGASLRQRAEKEPMAASRAFERGIAWREALYRVFSAIAAYGEAADRLLDEAAGSMIPLLAATRLTVQSCTVHRAWRGDLDDPERVLSPIAWSAHDLLLGKDLALVRECNSADCHWLFIDRSRNRSRRWCGMAICGNVEKARRFRRKHAAR